MLPLTGVKVIEIAQNIAGPYAGEILANLGADVVKVERPNGGDDARYWGPPITPDASHIFHSLNLNKRSVAIDLTDPVAVAWLKVYIAQCDVLVQNLRPGVMEDLGLDAGTITGADNQKAKCLSDCVARRLEDHVPNSFGRIGDFSGCAPSLFVVRDDELVHARRYDIGLDAVRIGE